jgi:hypothetical protein
VKTSFLFILILGIAFLGCGDNFDDSLIAIPSDKDNISLTKLVQSGSPDLSRSLFVDGSVYTEFLIDTSYFNSEGREIEVYARLKFPSGSFQGTRKITMIPKPEELSIELFPHMIFNETVKLDYIIDGLDLFYMGYTRNEHLDFLYYSPNGNIELIENQSSNVHPHQEKISLQNGKLSHFSRYGWVRKQQ